MACGGDLSIGQLSICEWCYAMGTKRCGRCHSAYYCSRDHQIQHWPVHKKVCKKLVHSTSAEPVSEVVQNIPNELLINANLPNISNETLMNVNLPSTNETLMNVNLPSTNETLMNVNLPSTNEMLMNVNLPSTSNETLMNVIMPSTSVETLMNVNVPSTSNEAFPTFNDWNQNILCNTNEGIAPPVMPVDYNINISSQKNLDFQTSSDQEVFSPFNSEFLSSDSSFWNLINTCDVESMLNYNMYEVGGILGEIPSSNQNFPTMPADGNSSTIAATANGNTTIVATADENSTIAATADGNSSTIAATADRNSTTTAPPDILKTRSLNGVCGNIIRDMNRFGICVLDKFIGSEWGELILEEVRNLYNKGVFKQGKLVNSSSHVSIESIRSDVTTWVDGSEPHCKYIGNLMKTLDVIIATCNKKPENGIFSKYKLHRRTKAMIACYPGDGTYYRKHIDNPNQDGRCITCIYYLNKDWDTKKHGGLLRMFPTAYESHIGNIEPVFDRMIFFWSDKRNPHEVLPAFATRFAITVWYFDADERERALRVSSSRAQKKPRT